ncbi:cobalt-precorrin-5B (C(1))-methyltransferase [Paenibacillus sp. HN-1]|uniref:cobalt-precorrin-5B (C(1))-methyltransferase n=1 Tax=Paenibacillus TaxID=44249 RepID=UPI001CA979BF|nr:MULTISPECIES: cobalt-precorrin-5B (C(1))-methyltransferase [Paenibacillus]MBY9078143.1 cobalt-precorrin-5B (C(1))-methyltransferase [Paenibacillus sp. CGMCC 1.18879]MBY9083884.1 cobalt-precorrin-5B (C(1))-methyltransferase [Paenibacillus sinensis]
MSEHREQPDNQKGPSMRHGFTTGSCAAAVAKAAVLSLITGSPARQSTVWIPAGFFHTFDIAESECARDIASCAVIKDAGDDPDATHGAKIAATAQWLEGTGLELDGGPGVGRVTKPGLPVPVGEAAINPVPRRMIRREVQEILDEYGALRRVKVVISVAGGEEIAGKTLNSRLGIVGGISILGTRGTVVPFSTAAYKASIVQALRVARAAGQNHVVLTTGGSSEKYAMGLYPQLPEESLIQMGNFVGFTLGAAKRLGLTRVSLVGMIGKFSKLAQGAMLIHSRKVDVDFGFLAGVAEKAGAAAELVDAIKGCNTAAQAAELAAEAGLAVFFDILCEYACQHCLRHVGGGLTVEVVLLTLKGDVLGRKEYDGEAH